MFNLGHSHPDFDYPNDAEQAKWTLVAAAVAAAFTAFIIIVTLHTFM